MARRSSVLVLVALLVGCFALEASAQTEGAGSGGALTGSSCITISAGVVSIPATCNPTFAGATLTSTLVMGTSSITSTGTIGSGATFTAAVGGASATSYGFLGGTNDGMFTLGAGNVNFSASGSERFRITGSTVQLIGTGLTLSWGTGVTQGNLGTPSNGNFIYCTDCTIANPCAGGGTGAFAKRLNGVWVCN